MAHKRKLGLPILFVTVVALGMGIAFVRTFSGSGFSWDGRLPSEFVLKSRSPTSPLKVAWSRWESYGVSTWNYESPFDIQTTDAHLAPIVADWSALPPSHGRGYEREPSGPSIRLFDRGDHTEVVACGERIKPTLLASWLAELPLDKVGLMQSRNTRVRIPRHVSPDPAKRTTGSKPTGPKPPVRSSRPAPPGS